MTVDAGVPSVGTTRRSRESGAHMLLFKNAARRMTRMRRVGPAKTHNGLMVAVVGAVVAVVLVFFMDRAGRTARFAPVRQHLKQWYLASSGRLDNAWSQLREVPADDVTAVA